MGQSYKLGVGQSRRFSFHLRTALGHLRPTDTPPAVATCPLGAESGQVGRHLAKSAKCQEAT